MSAAGKGTTTTEAVNVDDNATGDAANNTRSGAWRGRSRMKRFPEAVARRQSGVMDLALVLLGRDKAMAFLNGEHPALGGKPIDLAASEQGCAEVEAELRKMTLRETAGQIAQ